MARPLRILGSGLIYHLMSRGNNKMPIFIDDRDHFRFDEILEDVVRKYQIDCWMRCDMPNHYHLVWRTRLPNLSDAMRQLNGCFAQWWNRCHGHVGHVFQGRFKGQIVEDSLYLLRLVRYLALNPVRARLCTSPEEWRWSSFRNLMAGTSETWMDSESLVARFESAGLSTSREQLLAFVAGAIDEEIAACVRTDRRIIGSEEYAARFEKQLREASKQVPAEERRAGSPSLAKILASALETDNGLREGIVRAHRDYAHSVEDIARCTHLSPKTIARVLRHDLPGADVTALD